MLDAHGLAVVEGLSWVDSQIAEAAFRSGCDILCSEKLSHGGEIQTLRVIQRPDLILRLVGNLSPEQRRLRGYRLWHRWTDGYGKPQWLRRPSR